MSSSAVSDERTPLLDEQRSVPQDATETEAETEAQPKTHDDEITQFAEELSTLKQVTILGSIWFTVFFAAVDSTIVATLSGPISNSFNSFKLVSWLATAYLISNSAFQPLSGKLTDIYGRKAGLVVSGFFFTGGTLICGLAKTEATILAGRVIAGMGGGCLMAISTYVASDIIPLRKRGIWQGFGNLVWGAGGAVGGLFGGWINDVANWRWAFLIQVPFLAASTLLVYFVVKIPTRVSDKARIKRVDFAGAGTLVVTLVLLLLGLNSGGNLVPWNHPLVYIPLPLAAVTLGLWVYIERKVAVEPMIPVFLLANRTVAAACFTNWFVSMGYFAFLYYGPIYYQILGATATQAGLRILPAAVGISVGSLGCGYLMRLTGRYYFLNAFVMLLLVVSGFMMVFLLRADEPDWVSYLMFFLVGFSYGGMLTITLLGLISAVEHKYQAIITAASYAARTTGSSIGITIASTVFQNCLAKGLESRFGGRKGGAEIIQKLRDNFKYISQLPPMWQKEAMEAYMKALQMVWVTLLIIFCLGAVASLLMREHTLHSNLSRK